MANVRLSRGLCAVVGSVLPGSHPTLDALFHLCCSDNLSDAEVSGSRSRHGLA